MGEISVLFAVEAEQLLLTDLYEDAIDLCYSGLKLYPEYASAYSIISRALLKLDKKDDAINTINNAIKLFPSNKLLKSVKDEIENFESALEQDPFADSSDNIHIHDDPFSEKINHDNMLVSEKFSKIVNSNSAKTEDSIFSANSIIDSDDDIDSIFSNKNPNEEDIFSDSTSEVNLISTHNFDENKSEEKIVPDLLIDIDDSFNNNKEINISELNDFGNIFKTDANQTLSYQSDGIVEVTVLSSDNSVTNHRVEEELETSDIDILMSADDDIIDDIEDSEIENIDDFIDELNNTEFERDTDSIDIEDEIANIALLDDEKPIIEGHITSDELMANLTAKLNAVNSEFETEVIVPAVETIQVEKYNFAESTYEDELGEISDDLYNNSPKQQIEEIEEPIEDLAQHLKQYVSMTGFVSKFTNAGELFDKRIKSRKLDIIPGLDNSPIRDKRQLSRRIFHYQCLPQEPEFCIQQVPAKEHFEDFSSLFGFKEIDSKSEIQIIPSDEPKKELITETIANIYVLQGAYSEAIKAYSDLAEIYPEKKDYFEQKIISTQEKEESIIKD